MVDIAREVYEVARNACDGHFDIAQAHWKRARSLAHIVVSAEEEIEDAEIAGCSGAIRAAVHSPRDFMWEKSVVECTQPHEFHALVGGAIDRLKAFSEDLPVPLPSWMHIWKVLSGKSKRPRASSTTSLREQRQRTHSVIPSLHAPSLLSDASALVAH